MADNIAVTAGSGTTVSTEEVTTLNGGAVSAQHLQRVALAVRTADGVASDIPAGSGAAGTTTPRVISATDDPLVTRMTGAAHDAAISGSPHRIGARALTSNYTAVSSGDTADLICATNGVLITKPYAIQEVDWSYAAASGGILNTTTAVTIKAAAGAGLQNYITSVQIMAEALGTATEVAIRAGAGGTVIWRTKIPTSGLLGGLSITFPMPLKSGANTLLEAVTLTASGTGAVYFNAQGYAGP